MIRLLLSLMLSLLPSTSSSKACNSLLGVSDGTIKDSQMTSSSSFSPHVGAHNGRLGWERGGGAWCPSALVSRETALGEWLEVDLGREVTLTGVLTQGRYAGGHGQEFAQFLIHNYRTWHLESETSY